MSLAYVCELPDCPDNNPGFSTENTLGLHYYLKHNDGCLTLGGKLFKCPACNDQFQISAGLFCQWHFAQVHGADLTDAIERKCSGDRQSPPFQQQHVSFTILTKPVLKLAVVRALFPETDLFYDQKSLDTFLQTMPACTQSSIFPLLKIQSEKTADEVLEENEVFVQGSGVPVREHVNELEAEAATAQTAPIPNYQIPRNIQQYLESKDPKLNNTLPPLLDDDRLRDNTYIQESLKHKDLVLPAAAAGLGNTFYVMSRAEKSEYERKQAWCYFFPNKVQDIESKDLPPTCLAKQQPTLFRLPIPQTPSPMVDD
jgi:hypothetical protein